MPQADSIQIDVGFVADDAPKSRSSLRLVVDAIIDPARAKELINPEFVPDGPFLLTSNERGCVGYRYDALPAAVADEPTAFGCLVVKDEGHDGAATLIAILWDGAVTRCHKLSPVDARTTTVAEAGGASSASGGALAA